jgi:hypothetical protein
LQDVGALVCEQAGELRFLARFEDEDAIAIQSVSHDSASNVHGPDLFILLPGAGLAQGLRR